jgi:hypothetical protein
MFLKISVSTRISDHRLLPEATSHEHILFPYLILPPSSSTTTIIRPNYLQFQPRLIQELTTINEQPISFYTPTSSSLL